MQNHKALLIISFGSSYAGARKAIDNIENHIASQYPQYDLFRAFTSNIIIRKLKERDGLQIDTPAEALKKIAEQGYQELVCQSLHVINGIEYELTQKEVMKYAGKFHHLSLGKPLLTTQSDYEAVAEIFRGSIPQNEALLLMGHGTPHFANASYSMLEEIFRYKGIENAFVGTVEGFPDLDYSIHKIKQQGFEHVHLMPLMVVAGDHAINDMASDEEDSWKTILESRDFSVEITLQGLGEYPQIADLYYQHSQPSPSNTITG